MPEVAYWKTILKESGYTYYNEPHSKEDVTPEHKCNPFQFIALKQICANDDNRYCDFKITILAHDVVKIECFAYRDNCWETCFHGKIFTERQFDLLMEMYLGDVENTGVESMEEIRLVQLLDEIKLNKEYKRK
jgi:hypothetical protein